LSVRNKARALIVIVAVQPHMFNSDFRHASLERGNLPSYFSKKSCLQISAENLSLCQKSQTKTGIMCKTNVFYRTLEACLTPLKVWKFGACHRFRDFKYLFCGLEDFSISFLRYGLNKSSKFAFEREKVPDRMVVMPLERSKFI